MRWWGSLFSLLTLLIHSNPSRGDATKEISTFQDYLTQQKISEFRFPDLCPPPKKTYDATDCSLPSCISDVNCTNTNESCCSNGCIYTCLPHITPPPAFDWIEDPSKFLPVILDQENEEDGEIACSTFRGFATHSCPEGYTCQILEPGDPLRGIANRGVCVNIQDLKTEGFYVDEFAAAWSAHSADSSESVYLPGGCLLTPDQYKDIEDFLKGRHFTSCTCSAGSVLCKVPRGNKKENRRGHRRKQRNRQHKDSSEEG